MKKAINDKTSRRPTLIKALGITLLAFFFLVSITGAIPLTDILNSGSNNVSNLNKSDEALKELDKAIEINPHNSYAWHFKGAALYKLNKSDEAIAAYDKAIEINPQSPMPWISKGVALDDLNRSDEAIKAYDKAIEINPQNSVAWYNKGNALDNLDKFNEAIKAYDKATEINLQLRSLVH